MDYKPVLTLQSINIEWAKTVSLEEFKLNLAYYNNQNLEAFYNVIHGINPGEKSGGTSNTPTLSKNKKNGNSKRSSKKPKKN